MYLGQLKNLLLEIRNIKLLKTHINIAQNMPKSFELKVERRAQIKAPKKDGDRTALLNLELEIQTLETEGIKIELEADVIFEFETILEDYAKVAEEICVPMAQKEMLNRLDEILIHMGYKKMRLAEKI